MSDAEWDEEETPPLPCPIRAGPGSITWSRPLPPELEEISARLARIGDRLEWFRDDPEELERYLRAVILAYECSGASRTAEMFPPIYLAFIDLVSVDARRHVFDRNLEGGGQGERRHRGVVADRDVRATPAAGGDGDRVLRLPAGGHGRHGGFRRLRLSRGLRLAGEETRAGVFQGLMVLGDADVLDMLRSTRWELTDDEVLMVCSMPLDGSDTTVYLFLLDWLEEAQAGKDHARSRAIAAALTVDAGEIEREQEADNDAEVTGPPSLLRCEQPFFYVPIGDFARHIEPRLRALAEHETGWPVVAPILEGWGLLPMGEAS